VVLAAPARAGEAARLGDGPVRRGRDWQAFVAQPQTDAELVALRHSAERGVPYGSERWQKKTVAALGLESTLRSRGRPRAGSTFKRDS
jgi:putative transposase